MPGESQESTALRSAWDARERYWADTFGPLYSEILDSHLAARTASLPLSARKQALDNLADRIKHFITLATPYIEPDGLGASLDETRRYVSECLEAAESTAMVPSTIGGPYEVDIKSLSRNTAVIIAEGADALFSVFERANQAAAKSGLGGPIQKTTRLSNLSALVEALKRPGAAPNNGQ